MKKMHREVNSGVLDCSISLRIIIITTKIVATVWYIKSHLCRPTDCFVVDQLG